MDKLNLNEVYDLNIIDEILPRHTVEELVRGGGTRLCWDIPKLVGHCFSNVEDGKKTDSSLNYVKIDDGSGETKTAWVKMYNGKDLSFSRSKCKGYNRYNTLFDQKNVLDTVDYVLIADIQYLPEVSIMVINKQNCWNYFNKNQQSIVMPYEQVDMLKEMLVDCKNGDFDFNQILLNMRPFVM